MSTTRRVQSDALAYALRARGRTFGAIARRLGVTRSMARRSIIRHEQRIQQLASGAEAHEASEALIPRERQLIALDLLDIEGRLTAREREHIALVAQGLSNTQIARHLGISEATVKMHLHNVFRKLRIRNRAILMRLAYDHGWPAGAQGHR